MLTFEPGVYHAQITDQSQGESPGTGTPFLAITCKILSRVGPDGRARACPPGQHRDAIYYCTERSAGLLAEALEILGLTPEQIDPSHPSFTPLVGKAVHLRCSHDTFNNRAREQWRIARPSAAGSPAAAARIGALLAAHKRRSENPPSDGPTDPPADPPAPPAA